MRPRDVKPWLVSGILDSSPCIALDGQRIHASGLLTDESAMIGDFTMSEKASQQCKGVLGKH